MTRDFTATVFIVHKGRVLLHRHKKFGFWLPLGGHIEPNELPEDAALREVKEECGLDIRLMDADEGGLRDERVRMLVKPAHILLEDIEAGHQHIDFIYYGTSTSDAVRAPEGESQEFRWFGPEDLDGLESPPNVPILAREAIEALSE